MIINDILDLIKFIKESRKEGKDLNKEYFMNYIEPLWNKFNEIHDDYKSAFKRYTDLITNEGNKIDDIIEEVKRDSIYSEDLRAELMSMTQNVSDAFPKTNEQFLDTFLMSLGDYFEARSYFKVVEHNNENRVLITGWSYNPWRHLVVLNISDKNKEERKELLDDTVEMLQSNYKWVAENFYKLKKKMV